MREKTNRGKSKEDKGNQRNYKRNRGPQNSGREKVVFFCSEGWNCCRRQENRPGFDVHHQARLQDYFGHPWPVCSFQINLSPPFFFGSDLPLDDLWASCSKSVSFSRWSVGKTSLARRFAQGKFDENQFATVGGSSTPDHFLFPEARRLPYVAWAVQPCIFTRWWTPMVARCSSKYGTRAPRHHARRPTDLLFIYFSK